jgi:L-rhamnose isomerase/sugar isomerase
MIQTVMTAQSLFARAAIVDRESLTMHQQSCSLIDAEECLKQAFFSDVEPVIRDWRRSKGIPEDPLAAFRASGYLERITAERSVRTAQSISSYA